MPDGDGSASAPPKRRLIWLAVALAACAIALAWSGWALWNYRSQHRYERQHAAENAASGPGREIIADCIEIARPKLLRCVVHAPDAKEGDAAAQYDLRAQQEMAEWAFAIFLASLGSLVVTLVGLVYVIRAFRLNAVATQAATAAARIASEEFAHTREATERQLRAYVTVELGGIENVAAGQIPEASIIRTNVGQSPAYKVGSKIELILLIGEGTFAIPDKNEVALQGITIGPQKSLTLRRKFERALTDDDMIKLAANEVGFVLFGRVNYCDVFNVLRSTQFCHFYNGPDFTRRGGIYHPQANEAD